MRIILSLLFFQLSIFAIAQEESFKHLTLSILGNPQLVKDHPLFLGELEVVKNFNHKENYHIRGVGGSIGLGYNKAVDYAFFGNPDHNYYLSTGLENGIIFSSNVSFFILHGISDLYMIMGIGTQNSWLNGTYTVPTQQFGNVKSEVSESLNLIYPKIGFRYFPYPNGFTGGICWQPSYTKSGFWGHLFLLEAGYSF